MILVSEIRPELYREAQKLVPGRYSSFDELLNLALENQLRLEERGPGPLARPDVPPPGRSPSEPAPPSATREADVQALDATEFSSLPEPPDPNVWSSPLLWGQINRLLPAMAGVRVLGHLQLESEAKEVPLAIWHERAAAAATSLHAQLLDLDHQAQRRRGDLWSIGFPSGDRASTRRYANQFLGRGSRRAPGAAEMIGLVAIRRDGEVPTAAITASGVELSALENPVFDRTDPSETISEAEADLLLQVLARQLPEERAFMALMAKLIEGTDSRVGLEQELIRQRPDLEKYASTMRAGAIGRLHDLGFLSRTREGTKVRYSLSSRAAKLGLIS
jgi:hypothetical protein